MDMKALILNPNAGAILRELHERGELASIVPVLAELDINDHRSHRHKNNFFHSLQVLDNARELGSEDDLILLTAALFHDIGKPATRAFDEKGNVSFTAHEHVGAKLVKKVLRPFGYSEHELKEIHELIANHMRGFGFADVDWTDSAVRRFASEISSEEQLARLLVIFRADVTTKNESFKRKIFAGVDELERRITEVKLLDAKAARRPAVNGNELMERFGLKPGKELGTLMKYLNSEEGLALTREEVFEKINFMIN